MRLRRRPVPLVPLAFGAVSVLVIVVVLVLSSRMNRQAGSLPEPPDLRETAAGRDRARTGRPAADKDQQDSDDEQPLPRAGYTIAGRVVDEQGKGVAHAEVVVSLEQSWGYPPVRKVETDAEGRFLAEDLPRRHLFITAAKEGYCYYFLEHTSRLHYPVYHTPEIDCVTGVRLVLRPGAVLAGKVVDTEDQPVANAVVRMNQTASLFVRRLEVSADGEGRFRATDLVPGHYRLGARAEGFVSLPSWSDQGKVTTGSEDIVLRLERGCLVEGTVIFAESGDPVPGANVVAQADRWSGDTSTVQVYSTETDAHGHFEIFIFPNEETELSASWEEYYSEKKPLVRVEKGGSAGPVVVELAKWCIVSGTVVEEATGKPAEGVRLFARSHPHRTVQARSDAEGRFSLKGLPPGKTRLTQSSREHTLSRKKSPDRGVYVDVPASGIELRLGRRSGVSGTVVNEQQEPIPGAVVSSLEMRSSDLRTVGGQMTVSGAGGRFFVANICHGEMTGLSVKHPRYVDRSVTLEKEDFVGGRAEVRIVLDLNKGDGETAAGDAGEGPEQKTASAYIAGTVANNLGTPVDGVWVVLNTRWRRARTDSAGTYRFDGLEEAKEYKVKVDPFVGGKPRYKYLDSRTVRASADEINFIVEPVEFGSIAGFVSRRLDGSPVTKFCLEVELEGRSVRLPWRRRNAPMPWRFKKFESEDGFFRCVDLFPGDYIVEIAAPGLSDFETRAVKVEPNAETVLDVLMGEGGNIRGRIVKESGEGLPGVVVQALTHAVKRKAKQDDPEAGWSTKTRTDELGAFMLLHFPPGSMRLKLSHPDYDGTRTMSAQVSEGETKDVGEILFEEGALVHGSFADAKGTLRAGVYLRLNACDEVYQWRAGTQTDEAGRFSFAHVPNGSYILTTGYMQTTVPVAINGEPEKEVNLDFSQVGKISGKLQFPPDQDPATITVYLSVRKEPALWPPTYARIRSMKLQGDESFELEGLLPGKYRLVLADCLRNDGSSQPYLKIRTDPAKIIVEVSPKEHVRRDIKATVLSAHWRYMPTKGEALGRPEPHPPSESP